MKLYPLKSLGCLKVPRCSFLSSLFQSHLLFSTHLLCLCSAGASLHTYIHHNGRVFCLSDSYSAEQYRINFPYLYIYIWTNMCVHNLQCSVIITTWLRTSIEPGGEVFFFYFIASSSHSGQETGNTVSFISVSPIPEHIAGQEFPITFITLCVELGFPLYP